MHQKIRGRWQAAFFSPPQACVLPFRPRCRSALKIPAWNPWEPRRTKFNAYNSSLASQWSPPSGPRTSHLRVYLRFSTLIHIHAFSFFHFVCFFLFIFFGIFIIPINSVTISFKKFRNFKRVICNNQFIRYDRCA